MKSSHLKVLFVFCMLVSLIARPAISQDADNMSAENLGAPVPITASHDKETAIYGEVQTIDAQAGNIAVQYYDYDSDSEKTADIAISADTKLENALAISEIKKGDWVDVTYTSAEGKNTAKVVTVEKEDFPAPDETPAQGAASVGMSAE